MEATEKKENPRFEKIAKDFLGFQEPDEHQKELIVSLAILLQQSYMMGIETGLAQSLIITPWKLN